MFGSLKKRLKSIVKAVTVHGQPETQEIILPEQEQAEVQHLEEDAIVPDTKEGLKIEKEAIEIEKQGILRKIKRKVAEKTLTGHEAEKLLKELKIALLENDVALEAAESICSSVKASLAGSSVARSKASEAVRSSLRSAMLSAMSQERVDIEKLIEEKYEKTKAPFLIVMLGFNGVGKTTSLAKLAYSLKKYRPVIAAADTFRAASIEQLEEHAKRLGARVIKHSYGADSAAVIFDAAKHAAASGSRLVLADTAGRNHANVNLMDELKKICRVNKPDMKILVLDSLAGNDIYEQSRLFDSAVGVDAVILAKADVYEKGASLSAAHAIGKPIIYMGTGQEYEDLKEFVPEKIVDELLEQE